MEILKQLVPEHKVIKYTGSYAGKSDPHRINELRNDNNNKMWSFYSCFRGNSWSLETTKLPNFKLF